MFVAFLLDEQSRLLLEGGEFAALRSRDAALYAALSRLAPEERELLMGYLRSPEVALGQYERAA